MHKDAKSGKFQKNKYSSMDDQKGYKTQGERACEKFTDLMISRMKTLNADWEKPWISIKGGSPINLTTGKPYKGFNSLMLSFYSQLFNYPIPAYLTMLQANKLGARINSGSKGFPITFWETLYFNRTTGEKIPEEEFVKMTEKEKENVRKTTLLRSYTIFNVAQTNLEEVQKEKYEAIKQIFEIPEAKDVKGMYSNTPLDRMFNNQEWLCPIHTNKPSNSAFYSPLKDEITIPMKEQFRKGITSEDIYQSGMAFYGTALHEMAHSTGTVQRLNREKGERFADKKYAKEELVAELTSAMVGGTLGFEKKISENNAKYLNNWIATLGEEPKFIMSLMSDINKATEVILGKVEEQQIKLGERTKGKIEGVGSKECNVSVFKMRDGHSYAIRALIDGQQLPAAKMNKNDVADFFNKKTTKEELAQKYFHHSKNEEKQQPKLKM